jgi:hypothetical protein
MQPNEITLMVDTTGDGSAIVSETLTRFEEFANRSKYIGEGHAIGMRDELSLYRTFPKQSGNLRGVAKSAVKTTKDIGVPGVDSSTTITQPMILDLSASVPVGATDEEIVYMCQRGAAILALELIQQGLVKKLMV